MKAGLALTLAAIGFASAARADDALDRCWQVRTGMRLDEVNRIFGTHLPMGWVIPVVEEKYFPCALRIHNLGVSEIQIDDHRIAPPNEALFAEELKRRIAMWGQPDWIDFNDDRLRWLAVWGDSRKDKRTSSFSIELDQSINTGSKNGSLILDIIN